MYISDLQPGMYRVNIEAKVIDKGPIREFNNFGRQGRVCELKIQDKTGEFTLVLWNEEIDKVQESDKIRITNGYIKRYQGLHQLSIGRYGTFEVID